MRQYLKDQKEKILEFAREMRDSGEITQEKLEEVYFEQFVNP